MPFCNECGMRIQTGRLCSVCVKDEQVPGHQPDGGPEYVACDNCRGRSWVRGPQGEKVDCDVCDGFGKVPVVTDGSGSASAYERALTVLNGAAVEPADELYRAREARQLLVAAEELMAEYQPGEVQG